MRTLEPAERLIVAADFKPITQDFQNRDWAKRKVLNLADSLANTGVYLKMNSVLRACGYDLIDAIHARGLKVFADLKLYDISETLSCDGAFLREAKPELLTVSCNAGVAGMQALKAALSDRTELLGVTVLTSFTDDDSNDIHDSSVYTATQLLAQLAVKARLGGIVCAPREAEMLREQIGSDMTINTPGVRPVWAQVAGDDQNKTRVMTPADAIRAGADRIVVGRPIVQTANPREAALRTIEEISSSLK